MRGLAVTVLVCLCVMWSACNDSRTPNQPGTDPPVISLFSADSTRISFPTGTTIRWEVLDKDASVRVDPYPGNVPNVGSAQVTPTNTFPMNFTITARNAYGTTQRFLTIIVN